MGISFDSRPPCWLRRLGLRCLYTRLTPSTTTLFSEAMTRRTFRERPFSASSPVITSTRSSLRISMIVLARSNHLGRQAHDLQEPVVAELASHGAEDAGAARVLLVVDEHQGIAVEAHVAAVVAARRLAGADDDPLDHVAGLDVAAGDRLLDAGHDDVTQA